MNSNFKRYIQILLVIIWATVLFTKSSISHYYRDFQFAIDYSTMYSTIIEMMISLLGVIVSTEKNIKILFVICMLISFSIPLFTFLIIIL